jgi:hypothetical protein
MSSLPSPVRDRGKVDNFLPDPSSFPLSRPMAGYVSGHSKEPPYAGALSLTRDHESFNENLDNLSVTRMGQWDSQNVMHRDPKRPEERSRDKAYKQRFSMGSSSVPEYRTNVVFQTAGDSGLPGAGNQSYKNTPAPSGVGHGQGSGFPLSSLLRQGGNQYPDGSFDIFLVFTGGTVVFHVWDSMPISQLISEAGVIYGVDPKDLGLVLFSGSPTSFPRTSGPPRIAPGSTVLVLDSPKAEMKIPPPPRPLLSHHHDHADC